MPEYKNKNDSKQSSSISQGVFQKKEINRANYVLQDNRSESIQRRELKDKLNFSPFVQKKRAPFYLQDNRPQTTQMYATANAAAKQSAQPVQKKENNTGMPDSLKSGIESLSGYSMDDVKVHYNSDKPAQLNAHAYAQGTDIHLASGQEQHLPHEAWHVVQQKQGRVKPTLQMKAGVNINDDDGLEKEADTMGSKALRQSSHAGSNLIHPIRGSSDSTAPVQRHLIINGTNADFVSALTNVLHIIRSSAPSETSTLLHYAENLNYVDLVIRNDIPWYKHGLEGLTSVKVRYGTDNETFIKDEILRKNTMVDTRITDKLTIVVQVGLPIMAFWNRNQGRLASTLLHELTIHAARNVALIDRLRFDNRADELLGADVWNNIRSVFSINDSHHEALKVGNTEDDFRKQYRGLTNSLIDYYRHHGDESNAMALHKAYWDDLWEHSPGVFPLLAQLFGITLSDDI